VGFKTCRTLFIFKLKGAHAGAWSALKSRKVASHGGTS